jgi:hypothetical protein
MLIATYAEHQHKFCDPRLKKRDVWDEIAEVISKTYLVTGSDCAKKWSNLEIR